MKILIVDDSKAMRLIVRRTLRQAGFGKHDVEEAADGAAALAAIRTWQPDLVLTDWNMPEMTGLEMLQALRTEGLSTRVGFVTSECTQKMRDLAASEGALFLIAKPFNAVTFEETLTPYLG